MATLGNGLDLVSNAANNITICLRQPENYADGVWRVTNTLKQTLPMFTVTLLIVLFFTRTLRFMGSFIGLPRLVSEMIGCIIVGPSVLGYIPFFYSQLFPFRGNMVLETLSSLGLCYYMFLVGLDMDITPIKRTGKKALSIALAGLLIPGAIGYGLFFLLRLYATTITGINAAYLWGVILSVTSFPDLAQIISHFSLLHTEFGKLAIKAGLISDLISWFLLAITVSLDNPTFLPKVTACVIPASYILVVRPALSWILTRTSSNGQDYNDTQLIFITIGVAVSALVTEMCGLQSIVGCFLFGIIMPEGEIRSKLKEKMEYVVTEILLPLFFLLSGFKINISHLNEDTNNALVISVIFLACIAKILATSLVSLFLNISPRDGLTLGILMSTKGTLGILILSVGNYLNVLDGQTYAVMVFAVLVMSTFIQPFVGSLMKSKICLQQPEGKCLLTSNPESELAILSCIHSQQDVISTIGIVEASNATNESPIYLYAVQLVELTGRASAMVIVRDLYKSNSSNRVHSTTDSDIFHAFEKFQNAESSVTIQPLTSVSAYKSMAQDICNIATTKGVNIIILPFHKRAGNDGKFKDEDEDLNVKEVNLNVLAKAPCSVAILINRGLDLSFHTESNHSLRHFAMFFIGGHNDREALAYAERMGKRAGVSLTVVRFLPGIEIDLEPMTHTRDESYGILNAISDSETERELDDHYINEFRFRAMSNNSVTYSNMVVNSGAETLATILTMTQNYHLFIIGRGREVKTAATLGLSDTDWDDCQYPELGVLGNELVASEFLNQISILVVQTYEYGRTSPSSGSHSTHFSKSFSYQRRIDYDA